MRLKTFILILILGCIPSIGFGQDKDDELRPDETEHMADVKTTAGASAELESKHPEASSQIRAFLSGHMLHANSKDVDAYLSDFLTERVRRPDLQREYVERAMGLKDLSMRLVSIEFAQIQASSAIVHTRQISTYQNEAGEKVVDEVMLSYWLVLDQENAWKILSTERRRLSAR